jgi:hypothetical protein
MKANKVSVVVLILIFSTLFLTSCEKEFLNNSLPGNSSSPQNTTRDGEGEEGDDDIDDDDADDLITDGGRDEDYDKSGKKKPKPGN